MWPQVLPLAADTSVEVGGTRGGTSNDLTAARSSFIHRADEDLSTLAEANRRKAQPVRILRHGNLRYVEAEVLLGHLPEQGESTS